MPFFFFCKIYYCNGAIVVAQVAIPPLGAKRTTPSSTEQKDRTPVVFAVAGFDSAW